MTRSRTRRRAPRTAAITFGLAWCAAGPALAQPAAPRPLEIATVTPDAGSATLTIAGANFGSRPLVTLDLIPLDLQLSIDTRIVASVPVAAMSSGRYVLTVSRGPAPTDSASFELTLGQPRDAVARPPITREAAPAQGAAETAATVGDRVITVGDVDREWQRTDPAGYLAVMQQLYENRLRAANTLVSDELLAREAAARHTTAEALLKEEVPKRTIALPDAAVTSLYQSLGDRTRGVTLDQMRPALRAWLERNTGPELARMSYVEELMKVSARAEVALAAPRVQVERTSRDPVLGPATAPIEIVAFGDLQSTEYVRLAQAFGRVRETFGDRVRVVFKPLPTFGDASTGVAEAAACANAQGRFWAFHDAAAKPGTLNAPRLKQLAREAGLDPAAFDACVDGGEFRDLPTQAVEEAGRYGVTGSPSFFVNGRLAPAVPPFLPPFEFFKRLIEEELQRQARDAAKTAR
jgi:protein-disulfide isomerase